MAENEDLISRIMEIEWEMFSAVNNRGGRAACQEDPVAFHLVRSSMFMTWSAPSLESYLDDLTRADAAGRNLMTEKYARMEGIGPSPDPEKKELIEAIIQKEIKMLEAFAAMYPDARLARPIHSFQDSAQAVSSETYARGELSTYSERTLDRYFQDLCEAEAKGLNRIELAVGLMLKQARSSSAPR